MTDLFSNLNVVQSGGFVPAGTATPNGGPDTATDQNPEASSPEGGPRCEVCGVEVPWSGRGRKPKRCQDHKTRTRETAGDDGPTPRGGRVGAADKRHAARLEAIVGDLQQGVGELAGTIAPVAPVTAGTMLLTGPGAIDALVRIAEGHPRMLDGLEMVAKGVPFVAVGKFMMAIMLAVAVDMGRMAPVGMAAEYLGVAEAAEKVGWQPSSADIDGEATETYDRTAPPPPRFKL